jgi:hypothetical protein
MTSIYYVDGRSMDWMDMVVFAEFLGFSPAGDLVTTRQAADFLRSHGYHVSTREPDMGEARDDA